MASGGERAAGGLFLYFESRRGDGVFARPRRLDAVAAAARESARASHDAVDSTQGMVKTKEKLVIIAEDVVGEALSALVVNKMRGVLDICAMKAPGFGVRRKDLLQDIAIATGATYVAQEVGVSLETVTPEMLGTCERMVIGKEETTIVTDGKQAEAMEKRIQQIRTEAENTDSQFDKEKAEERVAALGTVRRPYAIDATRVQERRSWVFFFSMSSRFGPRFSTHRRRHRAHQGRRGHRDGVEGQEAAVRGCLECRQVGPEDGYPAWGWFYLSLLATLRGRDLQRHRGRG